MQLVSAITPSGIAVKKLPGAHVPIGMGAIAWGRHDQLCTPAYWASQAWMLEIEHPEHYRLGTTLEEEVLACVLGGHGMPAEVGLAAFERLRHEHRKDAARVRSAAYVEALLREPLAIGPRRVRYRFPAQKARFVAFAMTALPLINRDLGDRDLRDALMHIPGIGPKTASWVVRNWRRSDEVSILDVHILRAGRILGIFEAAWIVAKHYDRLEGAYLEFAACIGAKASMLDSVMWSLMREIPTRLIDGLLSHAFCTPVTAHARSSEHRS